MKLTEKQSEIIFIAKEMFSERGYVETSMRDLAFQLDMKAASLYSYFKSKEDILNIICNETHDSMSDIVAELNASKESVEERFKLYMKRHVSYIINNSELSDIYNKYWMLVDAKNNYKFSQMNFKYFDLIKGILTEMFPNDEDEEGFLPHSTAHIMLEILNVVPKIIDPKCENIDVPVSVIYNKIINGFQSSR